MKSQSISWNEPAARLARWWPALLSLLLAWIGILGWWDLYAPALQTWFLREDSRFFATPPFSLHDLWIWFSSPQNSMYQYRPVTKVLWAFPRYFGVFDPYVYHWITISILAGAGLALFLLLMAFRVSLVLATALTLFFLLLPAHAKPLYWISAWHNTTLVCFSLWAIYLRYTMPSPDSPRRWLSLLFFVLAIGSRETGLAMVAPLVATDLLRERERDWWERLKISSDLLVLFLGFLLFLYVIHSPFGVAQHSARGIGLDAKSFSAFWLYLSSLFFPPSEGFDSIRRLSWQSQTLALATVAAALAAPFFRREAWIAILLAGAGISLHLLYTDLWFLEYTAALGAGVVILWALLLQRLLTPLRYPTVAAFFAGLAILALGIASPRENAEWPAKSFVEEGEALKKVVEELQELDRKLPPGRSVLVTGLERMERSPANSSMHWLARGTEEFIPGRYFFLRTRGTWVELSLGSREAVGTLFEQSQLRPLETPLPEEALP